MLRAGTLVVALLLPAPALAGDPWKDKPYTQWMEKDLHRILADSPWSKQTELGQKKHTLEAPEGAPGVRGTRSADHDDDDEDKRNDRKRDEDNHGEDENAVTVRWVSSRTLREARVRGLGLRTQIAEADADKSLPAAPEDYLLAVLGEDLKFAANVEEADLVTQSYLFTERTRQRIGAKAVEIIRTQDGKKVIALIFHFPKKTLTGDETISADEKEVRFVSTGAKGRIRVDFHPREMIDRQGIDL